MLCLHFLRNGLIGLTGLIILLSGCQPGPYQLKSSFDSTRLPPPPDYSQSENWAALPEKTDMADRIPDGAPASIRDGQTAAKADVFFIHPTTYTYEPAEGGYPWNGSLSDGELNRRTDESTILNQASAFNDAGRVFAPRYRQAHYYSFLTKNDADKKQALDIAYSDVKAAFEYYLAHHQDGTGQPRPIIIAAHSQGTMHAVRLLKEFFDGKPLREQLVVAYLIGIAVQPNTFETIRPGESATETGCFVSWNTFADGYVPDYYKNGLNTAVCTNPLTWTITETYAPYEDNKGGVGLKFRFVPRLVDARNHEGLLWVKRPNVAGAALLRQKIWHRADINFYWMNLRENAAQRVRAFLNKKTVR